MNRPRDASTSIQGARLAIKSFFSRAAVEPMEVRSLSPVLLAVRLMDTLSQAERSRIPRNSPSRTERRHSSFLPSAMQRPASWLMALHLARQAVAVVQHSRSPLVDVLALLFRKVEARS